MKVYDKDGIIELTAEETAAFFNMAEASPELLTHKVTDEKGSHSHLFASFRARVERQAFDIYQVSGPAILIYEEESSKLIARYHENGLVLDEQIQQTVTLAHTTETQVAELLKVIAGIRERAAEFATGESRRPKHSATSACAWIKEECDGALARFQRQSGNGSAARAGTGG